MSEQAEDQVPARVDGRFPAGVSGNPLGRPKGSKNKVTLLKIMAEEAFRDENYDHMLHVCKIIVAQALAGDFDSQKLVWQSVMSKGSVDDRSSAQEKVEININAISKPEKGITIDVTTVTEEE